MLFVACTGPGGRTLGADPVEQDAGLLYAVTAGEPESVDCTLLMNAEM